MKFKINTLTLSDKLGLIQGISERRATMPILSHVLIIATSDKIKLSATDLETAMITLFDADIKKEGGIALPARKLYEILKEVPLGEIEIEEIGNHWAELRSKSTTFKIAGLPSEDFPILPENHQDDLFSIESAVIDDMIAKTIFAVSPDDMRRNLSGIYFEKTGKQEFIAEGNGITLNVRLLDAEFPNYKQVIPEATQRRVEVRQDDFLSALRRGLIIFLERTKGVKESF